MKRLVVSTIMLVFAIYQVLLAIAAVTVDFMAWLNNLYIKGLMVIPVKDNKFVDRLYNQLISAEKVFATLKLTF
ncbi:MAG: hypothetical protein R3321_00280 [Nitrososphaeraceae archaeon]|nr:hypothetical protein [Nitrososphaeraceae archaeon]